MSVESEICENFLSWLDHQEKWNWKDHRKNNVLELLMLMSVFQYLHIINFLYDLHLIARVWFFYVFIDKKRDPWSSNFSCWDRKSHTELKRVTSVVFVKFSIKFDYFTYANCTLKVSRPNLFSFESFPTILNNVKLFVEKRLIHIMFFPFDVKFTVFNGMKQLTATSTSAYASTVNQVNLKCDLFTSKN